MVPTILIDTYVIHISFSQTVVTVDFILKKTHILELQYITLSPTVSFDKILYQKK